jgi:hypothetical protein
MDAQAGANTPGWLHHLATQFGQASTDEPEKKMTEYTLDLDAIRARLADVPPGPWDHAEDHMIGGLKVHRIAAPALNHDVAAVPVSIGSRAVADLIVHARTDLPALIERVEYLAYENTAIASQLNFQAYIAGLLTAEADRCDQHYDGLVGTSGNKKMQGALRLSASLLRDRAKSILSEGPKARPVDDGKAW